MVVGTGRVNFWQKGKETWQKAKFLRPMSQIDLKKQIFPKNLFFLKQKFLWAHRMQFWQPGQIFQENQ